MQTECHARQLSQDGKTMDKFDHAKYQQLLDAKSIKLKSPLESGGLAYLEKVAEPSIPSQLVEMLKFGDGQSRHDGPPLFGGEFLESSKDIAGWITWHHEEEQGDKLSDCYSNCPYVQQGKLWRTDWIPIIYGPGGVFLYLDCAPSKLGSYGQVILSSVDTGKCGVIAKDLNELVALALAREELITSWPLKQKPV